MCSPSSIVRFSLAALVGITTGAACGPRIIGVLDAGRDAAAESADRRPDSREADGDAPQDRKLDAAVDKDAARDAAGEARADARRDAARDLAGDVATDGAGDGADAAPPKIIQVVTGTVSTCALSDSGRVRCWGMSSMGELGYGNTNAIGDDELPLTAGDVPLLRPAKMLASGGHHTCAILDDGTVTCWGWNLYGELGYGNTRNVGDLTPAGGATVDLGGNAIEIVAGFHHTCALLEGNHLRCWGFGADGQLGYATTDNIGDDESPASAGDVDVGGPIAHVVAGYYHTCALLSDAGRVRCWGDNASGQLGFGNAPTDGTITPASAGGDVPVGAPALTISAGGSHTCAVLEPDETVRCWGDGSSGQLGYGSTVSYGYNVPADQAPAPLVFGSSILQVSAGGMRTCARDSTGLIYCWGSGVLGNGNLQPIGDDELVSGGIGFVTLGAPATAVASGHWHSCAVTEQGTVRCWGQGQVSTMAAVGGGAGWLGYGNALDIADPGRSGAGDVRVFE